MKLPAPPKLPPKTDLEAANAESLRTEARLEQCIFVQAEAVGLRASNMSLEETMFERVALAEAKLEKLHLLDAELRTCDLSAAHCSESSWIRVRISGGRMTGLDLSRSTLKDVTFEGCKLDMVNVRFAKLTRVQFIDCIMNEADFQAAELTDVAFQNSHLEKVEFGQCKLKSVDARSSQLFDIRGWQSLKGLTIDSAQLASIAPQLAVELGLVIKE